MAKQAKQAQIAQHLEPIADGPEFDKTLVSCVISAEHSSMGGGMSCDTGTHSISQYYNSTRII